MTKKQRRDIYAEVTDTIIKSIESGVIPWRCPWDRGLHGGLELAYNASTKKDYRGVNLALLWAAQERNGYDVNAWMTYKQAQSMGGQVIKGEKSTPVIYWSQIEIEENGEKKTIPFLRSYNVFNVAQCDGVDIEVKPVVKPVQNWDEVGPADELIKSTGARIRHGGSRACYTPSLDYINMPDKTRFKKSGDYYCTLFHELTHWTGNHKRLNRDFKGRFGSESYAFEELIAELGSAFLFADLGLTGEVQHDSYIDNWLRVLKKDKKAIFKASTEASKAHKFIIEGETAKAEAA